MADIDAIVLQIKDRDIPVAIDSSLVVEILFLQSDNIFQVPRTKSPFIGITMLRDKTLPLIDFNDFILPGTDSFIIDKSRSYKLPFIILQYKNLQVAFHIGNVLGYEQIVTTPEESESIQSQFGGTDVTSAHFGPDKQCAFLEIDQLLSNYLSVEIVSKIEVSEDEEDEDFDLSQFTLPE